MRTVNLYLILLTSSFSLFAEPIQFSLKSKIYVAGHNGLVGRALVRKLKAEGYTNIITRTSKELDLRNQSAVNTFFEEEKPEFVFLSAAKVGGIIANRDNPASFAYDNIMIEANVIHAAYKYRVKKLLFLGSSCIYPRNCRQPIKEEYLLSGSLEETNKSYALAKIMGIQICRSYNTQYDTNFITCMPTNLYGSYDNFDLRNSHVLPALIAKIAKAKDDNLDHVTLWGTGKPMREFLFVDDLADACLFLMRNYTGNETLNIGTGKDITIKELAHTIKEELGYAGEIVWDSSKPDGTPRKLLDVSKINNLGWHATTSLSLGIQKTISWFNAHGSHSLTQSKIRV